MIIKIFSLKISRRKAHNNDNFTNKLREGNSLWITMVTKHGICKRVQTDSTCILVKSTATCEHKCNNNTTWRRCNTYMHEALTPGAPEPGGPPGPYTTHFSKSPDLHPPLFLPPSLIQVLGWVPYPLDLTSGPWWPPTFQIVPVPRIDALNKR